MTKLRAAIKFSFQGKKSRSNTPTIVRIIEPTNIHYCVKLHQNLTTVFKLTAILLSKKC